MINIVRPEGYPVQYSDMKADDQLLLWRFPIYTREIREDIAKSINQLLGAKYNWVYGFSGNAIKTSLESSVGIPFITYAIGCNRACNVPETLAVFIKELDDVCNGKTVYVRKLVTFESENTNDENQGPYTFTCRLVAI